MNIQRNNLAYLIHEQLCLIESSSHAVFLDDFRKHTSIEDMSILSVRDQMQAMNDYWLNQWNMARLNTGRAEHALKQVASRVDSLDDYLRELGGLICQTAYIHGLPLTD